MCIFQTGNFTGCLDRSEGVALKGLKVNLEGAVRAKCIGHTITGLQERLRERVCSTFMTFVNTEMSAFCLLDKALKKVIQDYLVESQVHVHAARM